MTAMPTGNTALQIKNMNTQLHKLICKLYRTRTYKTQAVQAIHVHPSILKFRPMFTAANPSEIDAHIGWAVAPLEQCIHRHYDKLENNTHQQMLNCMVVTHQTIQAPEPNDRNRVSIMAQVTQLFH